MNTMRLASASAKSLAATMGVMSACYSAYAGVTWLRYGRPRPAVSVEETDSWLDRFMPEYDVVERHHIRVAAPAETTLSAAAEMDLIAQPLVRTIFKARELILGAKPDGKPRPKGLLAELKSLGWSVLTEVPGSEIVLGTATQPWIADVVFRSVPTGEFAAFNEPGYVKIATTLRADAISSTESIFRTETRAVATDPAAREKFRMYWSLVSPGIVLIRQMSLKPLKREAERRARTLTVNR